MNELKSRTARLKLSPRGKPYYVATVTAGVSLGYRKLVNRAGSWCSRVADGSGGNQIQSLGTADDLEEANGRNVLSYQQAADLARKKINGARVEGRLTVGRALEEYEAGNKDRLAGNVSRVRYWLKQVAPQLLAKEISALTATDLKAWRNGIAAAPPTVNRTIRIMKAALNGLAEAYPEQVTNMVAWSVGLKQVKHQHEANNVVLSDEQVRELVSAAYQESEAFGLFVEVGAVTGARPSQIVRLEVRDLQVEAARLMMPTSKKGTGTKARNIAVPITPGLAIKLRQSSAGRGPSDPLLVRADGEAWSATSSDHRVPFERAVERSGLEHSKRVTFYALRHSSIVRRIKLGLALRLIAAIHDTSVVMIERHYSRDIDQYGDTARVGVLDLGMPARDNVVALRG